MHFDFEVPRQTIEGSNECLLECHPLCLIFCCTCFLNRKCIVNINEIKTRTSEKAYQTNLYLLPGRCCHSVCRRYPNNHRCRPVKEKCRNRNQYVSLSSTDCGKRKDGYLKVTIREQGWRGGESTRLPPMWPGFDSRSRCHMWVEFVVGSRPCSEGFSPGTPVFLPPLKPTFPNSNSTWKQWREEPLRGFH